MKKTDTRILYIGNKLAAHGRTPGNIDTLGPLLQQEGYTMYYSSSRINKMARILDMLGSIWRYRNKIDVVLIDTFSTAAFNFAWLCGRLCTVLGIKYIPILRGGNMPERLKHSPDKCRQLFGSSCMNITVSGYLNAALKDSGFNSVLIENHIELDKYKFRQREKLSAKLLWVRAFHQTYNPAMAVHVMAMLVNNNIETTLAMVGPELDGTKDQCVYIAEEKGILYGIDFTGKLSKEDWTNLAQQADIFINTTNFDNLPVSVIEAMALGLPVVSTNVGGIPFLIEDGKNGLLVETGNAEAMANAIMSLLTNPGLAATLSTNARNTARLYDWEILKHKWHKLFAALS